MKRYKIIVNPTSGRGEGGQSIPEIERLLTEHGLDYELVRTEAPGHAIQLAKEAAAAGFDVVVSAGGDGTANEVLNGLVQASQAGLGKAVIGVIPVGRGNDYCFGVKVPMGLAEACQVLAADQRQTIDVGYVAGGDYPDGRYFGNGVGVGFDAVVGFEALKLKRLHGFPSYIVGALKTIFLYYTAPTVRLEFNDRTIEQPALMVSIMNGRRLGGGFMMAPEGSMEDGLFDLSIADQVSKAKIFYLMLRFMQGTQASHPAIHTYQTSELSITSVNGSLPAHMDGETLCEAGESLQLKLLPAALEVVTVAG
jgi:YegS/Rv2252/BmrU family lipid kinase